MHGDSARSLYDPSPLKETHITVDIPPAAAMSLHSKLQDSSPDDNSTEAALAAVSYMTQIPDSDAVDAPSSHATSQGMLHKPSRSFELSASHSSTSSSSTGLAWHASPDLSDLSSPSVNLTQMQTELSGDQDSPKVQQGEEDVRPMTGSAPSGSSSSGRGVQGRQQGQGKGRPWLKRAFSMIDKENDSIDVDQLDSLDKVQGAQPSRCTF